MRLQAIKQLALTPAYHLIDAIVRASDSVTKGKLLLIRLDGIGDYVLFRNFIEILSKSERYRGYEITLMGNDLWKELSLEFDREFVHEFIWLDTRRFKNEPLYRLRQLKKIAAVGYEVIVSPTFSRGFYSLDWIVRKVHAAEKIGSVGDFSNITPAQKRVSDGWYTGLIPVSGAVVFEFERNRDFFEKLLGVRLDLRQPHIKVRKASLPLPPNYVVLFIGGSERWKKWPVQKFVKIGRFVRELGLNVILAGGSSDVADAEEYASMNDGPLLNLVGRTSLCELLSVIAGARMIVSNDTSAPHFAMAVGTPAVVLYNGNHYGRFVPYPSQVCSGYRPVYHPAILKDVEQYKIRSNTLAGVHDLNCDDIRVECVEDEIKAVLNSAAAT